MWARWVAVHWKKNHRFLSCIVPENKGVVHSDVDDEVVGLLHANQLPQHLHHIHIRREATSIALRYAFSSLSAYRRYAVLPRQTYLLIPSVLYTVSLYHFDVCQHRWRFRD